METIKYLNSMLLVKKLNIILIYMFLHFFHLLQPLDINFFLFFKKVYTKKFKNTFQLRINYIDKLKFLEIYRHV